MTSQVLATDYRIFAALYRHRSINSAARALGQDPANLSRTLRRLERSLGAALFHRHQTGLHPTETAVRLDEALQAAETAYRGKRGENLVTSRTVKIGFSQVIGWRYLREDFLEALMESGMSPEFSIATSLELVEKLKRRELDLAILATEAKLPGLIVRRLETEHIVLCSRSGRISGTLLLNSKMIALDRILPGLRYDQRWAVDDYFVLAKILERSEKVMGLLPEGVARESGLKTIRAFPGIGKVTAVTHPFSPARSLLKSFAKI